MMLQLIALMLNVRSIAGTTAANDTTVLAKSRLMQGRRKKLVIEQEGLGVRSIMLITGLVLHGPGLIHGGGSAARKVDDARN